MSSPYALLQGPSSHLATLSSVGLEGNLLYTTDTKRVYVGTGLGVGIPTGWTLVGGAGAAGVLSLNALTGALALTSSDSSVTITPSGTTIDLQATGVGFTFVDNEIVSGSGTAWTFATAPSPSTSVHLYVLQYVGGPFVRLPASAIVSIVGTTMVTADSWSAGSLLADYRS